MILKLYSHQNIIYFLFSGWNALHCAADGGYPSMIRKLLDYKLDVNSRATDGATPLYLAAQNNFAEIVQILLEAEADENLTDDEQWRPLHAAASNGSVDSLIVLLAASGAKDINTQNSAGVTALYLASQQGHSTSCKVLLEHAAAPNLAESDEG